MKKSHVTGIEVYFEDKPEVKKEYAPWGCPIGEKGAEGTKGAWEFGDAVDEEGYFDPPEPDDDYDVDEDIEEIKIAFEQAHDPVRGRIYKVRGLNLCAKYVSNAANVVKITCTHGLPDSGVGFHGGVIRKLAYHKHIFYVDEKNMLMASDEEVRDYLEESNEG